MTPTERAEKIMLIALDQTHIEWNEHGKENMAKIAAQIAEAEREAYNDGAHDGINVSSCDECFQKGFAAARERAKEIAEKSCYCDHSLTDPECYGCRTADRIAVVEPEGK